MSISDVTSSLAPGTKTLDLRSMAEKASGAWPAGWYPAEIIEGYTSPNGFQHTSGLSVSQNGDSFNMKLCVRVTNGKEVRTNFYNLNYRPDDFSTERLETIQRLRTEFSGQKGAWTGYEDQQRSSIAVGRIGQLQEATGLPINLSTANEIAVEPFVGAKLFVHYTINDDGFNEINRVSKFSNGVEPKARTRKQKRNAAA